jgi:Rrf2 family protein
MSFGVGLHVMLALAYNDGEWVSSANLGRSVGANPVTIRRVVGQLVAAGLVETQTGPGGGARLARGPGLISVDDVYQALGRPHFVQGHEREPVHTCVVSQCMPRVFDRLNQGIEKRSRSLMTHTTLKALIDEEVSA